ncbi:MAG: ABC transporter ATP-binding protein [Candidatus Marsarchaeota archaeon]|nr:ABC transporter ATP-binding protein [Candidatus Marsarchaeota archaeon]
MIEIKGLKKKYGDGTYALKGIDLTLKEKATAVLGRNGAGKTTLLRILSTQLLPTGGHATIDGYDVVTDADKLRKRMVSVPQEAGPLGYLTPEEHIKIYLTARGMSFSNARQEAARALKSIGLWEFRDKTADELSGGMKRKIFVAMALASDADIIFLDEPTVGLDPISRIEVWSALRSLGSKMVLTTHYIEEAKELTKDIVMIDGGRAKAHGTVERLLRKSAGMVRVESTTSEEGEYKIGGIAISYVKASEAGRYAERGYIVKPVDLEDLFIMKGEDK